MKPITTTAGNAFRNACCRIALLGSAALASLPAWAQLTGTPLTQDQSGGKKLTDVLTNVDQGVGQGTTVVLSIIALVGVFVFVSSLLKLRSSNPQDSKGMAIGGLFIGSLMFGVPSIMWAIRNGFL